MNEWTSEGFFEGLYGWIDEWMDR